MEKKETKEYQGNKSNGSENPGSAQVKTSNEPHSIAEM
jgi:hypothetical protein